MIEFLPKLADGIGLTLVVTFGSFAVAFVLGIPLMLMRRSRPQSA